MKRFQLKKVCIIFCGSVFDVKNNKTSDWLDQIPELKVVANIDSLLLSTKNDPVSWLELAETIYQKYNQYDGFVVIHEVDSIIYTATALSFLLQNLSKPIIFTGNCSSDAKHSGIKANLINSCRAATENIAEVCLMYGNRLLRANQARLEDRKSLNAFGSSDNGLLGQIDFSLRISSRAQKRNNNRTELFNKIDDNIGVINVTPFLSHEDIGMAAKGRSGILVVGAGHLPDNLEKYLKDIAKKTPVVIFIDECIDLMGHSTLPIINNMTFQSTVVKFSWALGQSKNQKTVSKLMLKDINGEIIKR